MVIIDDDMKIHPNSTYYYASLEESRMLIFPSTGTFLKSKPSQ